VALATSQRPAATLTLTPSEVRDKDVEKLRRVGWNDKEIFEASFDTALFAFFTQLSADEEMPGFEQVRRRVGAVPRWARRRLTAAGGWLTVDPFTQTLDGPPRPLRTNPLLGAVPLWPGTQ